MQCKVNVTAAEGQFSEQRGGILMPLCGEKWDYMPAVIETLPKSKACPGTLKKKIL